MEGNDNFDSFFKSKLEDGQANVPSGSWQAISRKVAEEKKQKSRGFMIPIPLFWIAASFLMGSVAGAVSFYTYNLKTENEKLRSQLFNNQNVQNSSNEGSKFYNPLQFFNKEGLNTRNSFFKKPGNNYDFTEFLDKPQKLAQASVGYHRNVRIEKKTQQERSADNNITVEANNEITMASEKHTDVYSGSDQTTSHTFSNQPGKFQENVEGNENTKSDKLDSLAAEPDSVIKIVSIAKVEQENKIKKAVRVFGFPISAGIYVTPEMASRSINFSEETDPELVKYKQKDERKFGFSAGLNLDIHLPKNFYFRTGINYWNIGEKNTVLLKHTEYDTTVNTTTTSTYSTTIYKSTQIGNSTTVRFDSMVVVPGNNYSPNSDQIMAIKSSDITSSNTKITESASQFSSTISNNYHYLGIPVLLGMKMSNKKLSFGLFSGLITNVLISPKSSVYYVYYDPEQPDKFFQAKRELSRFLLVYSGGMDFDYRIAKNWTVSISPNIKYSLTSIYKNASVKQLPYSFGVQFGVKFRIGS